MFSVFNKNLIDAAIQDFTASLRNKNLKSKATFTLKDCKPKKSDIKYLAKLIEEGKLSEVAKIEFLKCQFDGSILSALFQSFADKVFYQVTELTFRGGIRQ